MNKKEGIRMSKEKTKGQKLAEELMSKQESCYKSFKKSAERELDGYIGGYIDFLNTAKTEREFVKKSIELLEKNGYTAFVAGRSYKSGDKIYYNNHKKSLLAAIIGSEPLDKGVNITAAHIDSPRLDLKPNPLFEDGELCYFKTHYYGGLKKYQWVALPLSIHGVIAKKDGSALEINIGEKDDEPVFYITDILPHLSYKVQDDRTARTVIKGEELNLLIGSEPFDDEEVKEPVKLNIMKLLNEKYGITEDDFISAEIEIVPALKAKYVGFDKSMVGAYAHDDRVCAYTSLTSLLGINSAPKRTAVCVLADKEETGSDGNTGMSSDMLRNFLSLLSTSAGVQVENVIMNSKCLSADVNAAYDPTFKEVFEKRNTARVNYGPVITKYTGSGGKYSTNDASAEFMGEVRAFLDGANVPWQTGELGKVDEGGGGTVAKYISKLGVEVVDIGVALLSMHAPYEIASTLDIYSTHKAFVEFFKI